MTGPPAAAAWLPRPLCADAGPPRRAHGTPPGVAGRVPTRVWVQSRLRDPLPLLCFLLAGPPGATGAPREGLPIVTLRLLSTQTLTSDLVPQSPVSQTPGAPAAPASTCRAPRLAMAWPRLARAGSPRPGARPPAMVSRFPEQPPELGRQVSIRQACRLWPPGSGTHTFRNVSRRLGCLGLCWKPRGRGGRRAVPAAMVS